MRFNAVVLTVCFCLLVQPAAFADELRPRPDLPDGLQLRNVQLDSDGVLHGQILNKPGTPQPDTVVEVRSRTAGLSLQTDSDGRFAVAGLRTGICMVIVGDQHFACRVWAHNAAPPKSISSIAVVLDSPAAVRGNGHACNCRRGSNDCNCTQIDRVNRRYGLAILALGGTAAYFALSRDNASE